MSAGIKLTQNETSENSSLPNSRRVYVNGKLPGVSVPCGLSRGGLPVGLQLIGNHFDEARLLNAAYAYEQAVGSWQLPTTQE